MNIEELRSNLEKNKNLYDESKSFLNSELYKFLKQVIEQTKLSTNYDFSIDNLAIQKSFELGMQGILTQVETIVNQYEEGLKKYKEIS